MERAAGPGGIDLGVDLHPGDAAIGVDVGGTKTAIGLINAATLTLVASGACCAIVSALLRYTEVSS